MGVLHSLSIKNIFYDKTDLKLFNFCVTVCKLQLPVFSNFAKSLASRPLHKRLQKLQLVLGTSIEILIIYF